MPMKKFNIFLREIENQSFFFMLVKWIFSTREKTKNVPVKKILVLEREKKYARETF